MKKSVPKIFVSSTIYDFRDLRSALKYCMGKTGMGYEIYMSENPDFPVNRVTDSYSACLETITKCDYFILLIGNRTGGWYKKNECTITRQEYRVAYELAQKGKIKIIAFVRESLWDHRKNIDELKKFLETEIILEKEITENIVNHKSEFAHNPKHTVDFINEVSQNSNMRNAMESNIKRPIANWICTFNDFQDIMDCLQQEFQAGNIYDARLKFRLKKEIEANINEFQFTGGEKIDANIPVVELENIIDFTKSKDPDIISILEGEKIQVPYVSLKKLCSYCATFGWTQTPYNEYINKALEEGIFLRYDHIKNDFTITQTDRLLTSLNQKIQEFKEKSVQKNSMKAKMFILLNSINNNQEKCSNIEINDLLLIIDCCRIATTLLDFAKALLDCIINRKEPDLDSIYKKARSLCPFRLSTEKTLKAFQEKLL